MDHLKPASSTGTRSIWMFIIYHLPVLLQVSLLHQRFCSNGFRHQALVRRIRLLLVPINIYLCFQTMYHFTLHPLTSRGPLNLQFACWIAHLAMKSIEWGLVSTFEGDPTFQLRPEFLSDHHQESPTQQPSESTSKNSNLITSTSSSNDSLLDVFIWSIHQFTSFRGINFNWGWKGRERKRPTVTGTLRLFLISNLTQTIGLIGCVLTRDYGSLLEPMLLIGIPNFPGLKFLADVLSTLSWGLICSSGMEFSFCPFVFISILIDSIRLRNSTRSKKNQKNQSQRKLSLLDWWDSRLFVPLFNSPFRAKSLTSLWSNHWHQIYRRSFIFLGVLPATRLSTKLGLGLKAQRILVLFATFLVSGILHELCISFVAQSNHPAPYHIKESIRGSLFYFLMQPIGILLEPYIIRWIPNCLGGGTFWVIIFTLITARPFKNQYILQNRVIDDIYPPFKDWPLWAILWPAAVMRI